MRGRQPLDTSAATLCSVCRVSPLAHCTAWCLHEHFCLQIATDMRTRASLQPCLVLHDIKRQLVAGFRLCQQLISGMSSAHVYMYIDVRDWNCTEFTSAQCAVYQSCSIHNGGLGSSPYSIAAFWHLIVTS